MFGLSSRFCVRSSIATFVWGSPVPCLQPPTCRSPPGSWPLDVTVITHVKCARAFSHPSLFRRKSWFYKHAHVTKQKPALNTHPYFRWLSAGPPPPQTPDPPNLETPSQPRTSLLPDPGSPWDPPHPPCWSRGGYYIVMWYDRGGRSAFTLTKRTCREWLRSGKECTKWLHPTSWFYHCSTRATRSARTCRRWRPWWERRRCPRTISSTSSSSPSSRKTSSRKVRTRTRLLSVWTWIGWARCVDEHWAAASVNINRVGKVRWRTLGYCQCEHKQGAQGAYTHTGLHQCEHQAGFLKLSWGGTLMFFLTHHQGLRNIFCTQGAGDICCELWSQGKNGNGETEECSQGMSWTFFVLRTCKSILSVVWSCHFRTLWKQEHFRDPGHWLATLAYLPQGNAEANSTGQISQILPPWREP